MNHVQLRQLLHNVERGTVTVDTAHQQLLDVMTRQPFDDLGFARVDHHRAIRQGFPEVIFGGGKTPEQISAIAERIAATGHTVLVTRTDEAAYAAVRAVLPDAEYHAVARAITCKVGSDPTGHGTVVVACAGTSDLPVAEEARVASEALGNHTHVLYDVGVSGLHRVLAERDRLATARVIIAVAGMEGALASVIAGLVAVPVIAVPTSVGYGASFNGLAALLGMLNGCASGVAVVNIDNGFGAAAMASAINHLPL